MLKKLPPIILASASPRRAELLDKIGISYTVLPGHVDELEAEHLTPHETAQINAYRKARAVAKHHADALVLGADTVVSLGTRLFGKPRDLSDAARMLTELEGKTHEVVTGVCLLHLRTHWQRLFAVSSNVTFRHLQPTDIRSYLARIQPLDKAGGYAIQDKGEDIVEDVDGPLSNVIGLPIERLRLELERWPI
jgi:septum formation protein